jgi:hypothetical protein
VGVASEAREVLIAIDDDAMAKVLAALRSVARVTQVHPPHLILVAPGVDLVTLRSLAGVRWVSTDEIPPTARSGLTPAELLFVDGWEQRGQGERGRPGQGLSWDAPGFLPPDPPPAKNNDKI